MGNLFANDNEIEADLNVNEIPMKWPFIIFIIISMVIIFPIAVVMSYQYYTLRESYMYNNRRPILVLIFNSVATIFIGIYIPIHIIVFEIYWDNNATYDEYWDQAFLFTMQIIVFVTFGLRVWHSFFDFKSAHANSMGQWKSILSASYGAIEEGFYNKYKNSLGIIYVRAFSVVLRVFYVIVIRVLLL